MGRAGQETACPAAIDARLRDSYGLLEKTRPEAIAAFQEYVSTERRRAERMIARLSPPGRAECLANLETEEYRLGLFAKWVATDGRHFAGRPAPPDHPEDPATAPERSMPSGRTEQNRFGTGALLLLSEQTLMLGECFSKEGHDG
jgi:hypothetical protein